MKYLPISALVLACGLAAAQPAPVPMTAAERGHAKAEISKARAENDKLLQANEKICYQHFAVTDCLKQVRRQSNERERELRQRELAINAQERDERTAKQRSARDKKQQDFERKHHSNPLDGGALSEPDLEQRRREHDAAAAERAGQSGRSPQDMAVETQRRQQEAAHRAAGAQNKAASQQRAQQRRSATLGEDISESRGDFDAKQTEAAHRQAVHDKKMQELAKKGKKAAPLPTPP